MEVYDAIQRRRSIRSYEKRDIPKEQILKILETARVAPSASNRQPWHFIVVTDEEKKKKIAQSGQYGGFIEDAPAVIVACGDHEVSKKWYKVDVAIALEHIVLEAEELGLGTCWVGSFGEELIKNLLEIPEKFTIVSLLSIGYPVDGKNSKEKPTQTTRQRKMLEDIASFNKF